MCMGRSLHPQAEVENVTDMKNGAQTAYKVAYYENGKAGVAEIADNGQIAAR